MAKEASEIQNTTSQDPEVNDVIRGNIPLPPVFQDKREEREWLKFRLAQTLRIFGEKGFDEGVAGHITVRDPIRPDCFWVNPMRKAFSLIQPHDLILVDHYGVIQEGKGLLNTAAFMIHSAIHAARPDVHCAAHSHSLYGKTWASLGRELDPLTQDSCAFYQDHALYSTFDGVVLAEEEGRRITQALGNKKAAILQNHGILVATSSIEATLHFYIALEKACKSQLLAEAAAASTGKRPVSIPHDEAVVTYKTVGTQYGGWFSGITHYEKLEAKEGVTFRFSEKVKL
ncbi:hypothetical protein QCA50_003278 [Cerrena zonata]|uniref:Class II aldolase/adducin N-terminal domain-containing protein n=1 Tax=Cerrena zonata TaxID=2478898 RepID=A0AAW0GVW8_9APHY